MNVFKFEPIYMKRIWGGQQFQELFNHDLDSNEKFGESWNLVDRDENQTFCLNSSGKRVSLRELIEHDCHMILGPNWDKNKKFPILVKWLDCQERLSLQVHPPKKIAQELNGEPKTENWYVVKSSDKAGLFLGFKKDTKKEQFVEALSNSTAEDLCHRISAKPHDSVFVESGRIHAIDGGNLILEIQQNSDTTYRVYDWGRSGLDGKPRDLHIKQSLASIDFDDFEPTSLQTNIEQGIHTIAKCDHFRIRKFNIAKNNSVLIKKQNEDCVILSPITGKIHCHNESLPIGYSSLSPYISKCEIVAEENSTLLVTDRFSELPYS